MDMEMKNLWDTCMKQEEMCRFTRFTREDALKLGLKLIENSRKNPEWPGVAIRIKVGGLTVFQYLNEGAELTNCNWMDRKYNTVIEYAHSSLAVMADLEGDYTQQKLDPARYALCGGGFPLLIKGVGMVGVITVSGLPHLDDHQLIVSSIMEYLEEQ